jgi:membrane protein DedA with SNARE-associated domain
MEMLRPYLGWFIEHPYLVVFVATLIDATGFPFPGRVILAAAGALAACGDASLGIIIALGALGALLTDHLWYFAGWFHSERLLKLYCRWTFGSGRCVRQTADYFRRFGALTIVIGRFVAGVRIFAWPLARSSGVGYARFLLYDAVGALLWTSTWALIGWVVGDRWESTMQSIGGWMVAIPLMAAAALVSVIAFRSRRRARHGAAALG